MIAIKDFGIKNASTRLNTRTKRFRRGACHIERHISKKFVIAKMCVHLECPFTGFRVRRSTASASSEFSILLCWDSGESWMPSARRRVPRWSNWQWLTVRCSDYLFIDLVVQTMNARVMVVECVGPKQIVLTVRTNDHAAFLSLMNRRPRWCMLLLPQADHNK